MKPKFQNAYMCNQKYQLNWNSFSVKKRLVDMLHIHMYNCHLNHKDELLTGYFKDDLFDDYIDL